MISILRSLILALCVIAASSQVHPPSVYTVTIVPAPASNVPWAGQVLVRDAANKTGTVCSNNTLMGSFTFDAGAAGFVCAAANFNPTLQPSLAIPFYGGSGTPIIQGLQGTDLTITRNISDLMSVLPYDATCPASENVGVMCPRFNAPATSNKAPQMCTGYIMYFMDYGAPRVGFTS